MSVLICDSNSEVWYSRLQELNVPFIAMPYTIGDEEYAYDLGEKTDFKSFYKRLENGEIAKTQAFNPDNYKEIIEPYFKKGEDVLYVSFSHEMSGTFNQLFKALEELKERYPERKCTVFNTKSISLGAGIQVEEAAKMKNAGASDEEIIEFLETFSKRAKVYFVVDDLMHLKRGGRLTATAAFAGKLLGIKPLLTVDETGSLGAKEKIMGKRKAVRTIADRVIKELTGTEYTVYVVDADAEQEGEELASIIREKRPEAKIKRQTIGPVVGAHCGRGTLGVIFIGD